MHCHKFKLFSQFSQLCCHKYFFLVIFAQKKSSLQNLNFAKTFLGEDYLFPGKDDIFLGKDDQKQAFVTA